MATSKISYTLEERVFIVSAFYENGRSPISALRKYRAKFDINTTLNETTISR